MVFEKVRQIICEQLSIPEEKITQETSLTADIGADSLDIFQIITNLEEEFGVEFTNSTVESVKTVGDAVAYIAANMTE